MKHYEEAKSLIDLLHNLVDRHPITPQTAPLWFEAAHNLLECAFDIRRQAWWQMSEKERIELVNHDPTYIKPEEAQNEAKAS